MNNIKKYRKMRKYTLLQLSKKTNLSEGYLCHLENGTRNNPSFKTMKKISDSLETDISDLFYF